MMRIKPEDAFDAIGTVFEVILCVGIAALVVLVILYGAVILS